MKVSEMFPRRWLVGSDLEGKAFRVKIEAVQQEEVRTRTGQTEAKWVLHLHGAARGLILHRTIAQQVADAVGSDDTQQWMGKEIVIYPLDMGVAGEKRIAIRVRKPTTQKVAPPEQAAAVLAADDDDATAAVVGGKEEPGE